MDVNLRILNPRPVPRASTAPPRKRSWRRYFVAAAVLAVMAIPVVIAVRVRVAEHAWAESFGPLDALPGRFHGEENETARMITEWDDRLGIPPSNEVGAVKEYAYQIASASPAPAAPPPSVTTYAREHADMLDAIVTFVSHNEPPSWSLRTGGRVVRTPVGLFNLQKVLIAVALVRESAGDHAGAEELLDAAWRLNTWLRERPEWFAQLFAIEAYRLHCTALRKSQVDPDRWLKRLREYDYRASLMNSLQVETWISVQDVKENIYADEEYIAKATALSAALGGGLYKSRSRWLILALTPIRWFDLPALIEGSRRMLVYAASAPVTDGDSDDLAAAYDRGFSNWFYIPEADLTSSSFASLFRRVDRAIAEGELTEKVLMAKAGRKSNGGQWPASISGFETSRIQNGRWRYERTWHGISIRFNRELHWPGLLDPSGGSAPLRYSAP